ncbi:MAG: recombinase family protein [Brachybacterium sp.]|uniref:recombinase family protein n=1 Tax=Brachybacterium sp. TaxID=1891286 RepID=UPI0026499505|nr:recombinase family protein [Brachybacterium sp.]MDN5685852.1 recombinase family protein [Brachybacterium sp.]
MTLYGYARVSTEEQSLQRQLDALHGRGVDQEHIYPEKASGSSERRPVLDHLLTDVLTTGDTLVITDLDRLSRRTARVILTLDDLANRDVTVESLYENVDTSTADGLFSVTILGALAQRERDRIAERTRAGLEAARARGRHPGRPVAVTPEQYETVMMLRDLGKSYRQVASSTGVSASTVARICREETPGHDRYRHSTSVDQ